MSERPLAIVTGASSGIGEAFAKRLAAKNYDLVLVARREDRLQHLADHLQSSYGVQATPVRADLSRPSGIQDVTDSVDAMSRPIDMLINNAGFGSYGRFTELEVSRELEMIDLNVRALVALTHWVLPGMVRQGQGTILHIASTAAFQPVPFMATYGASKAFVLSFSDAIAREVSSSGVRVLAVCPGHTPTDFHAISGVEKRSVRTAAQDREAVVDEAFAALETGAHTVVTGWHNKITTQAQRLLPRRVLSWAVGRAFRPR